MRSAGRLLACAALVVLGADLGAQTAWTTRAPLPAARSRPAVETINGVIYVAGGSNGTDTSSLYAYNPGANTWSTLASMPSGRYQASGAGVIDGKLYVPGGWTTSPGLPNSTLFMYDPATNTWSSRAAMPTLSGGGASGVIGGRLYVTTPENGFSGYRNFLHVYDPATNAWTARASSPDAHGSPAYGVIGGRLYVAGGVNSNNVVGARLDVYDPVTDTWATRASMLAPRLSAASAVIGGKLYVFGGSNGTTALSSVEVYDPAADTWRADAAMPAARNGPAAAVAGGTAYVFGGSNTAGTTLATNESFATGPLTPILASDAQLRSPGYMASDGTNLYVAGIGTNNAQGIFRVALSGGTAARVYNAGGPAQVAIIGTNVYWIDANSGPATDTQILRAPLAGAGTPSAIYTGSAVGQPIVDGSGLATNGTQLFAVDEVGGTLFRMLPDGSGLTQMGAPRYTGGFATEHLNTVTFNEGFVYVLDQGRAGTIAPQIVRMIASGTATTAFSTIFSGAPLIRPTAIVVAYEHAYVADPGANNTVWRIPVNGGTPVAVIAGAPFQEIQGLAIVGNDLFISDPTGAAIYKLAGGALPPIASTKSLAVPTGQTVALTVPNAAFGPTYRWFFNGTTVGTNEPMLVLNNIPNAGAGTYYCTVATATGTTTYAFAVTVGAAGTPGRLINLATRGTVGTGGGILIGGFVVGGTNAKTFLIRGIGPTLSQFGLTGTLANPLLQVYQGSTLLYTADDWAGSPTLANVFNAVGAFALGNNSQEAVLVVTLPAGDYTAQLSGSNGGTGIGLIEIFEVP